MTRRMVTIPVTILAIGFMAVLLGPVRSAEVLPFGLKIEKVLDQSAPLGDLAQAPNGELWLLERATGVIRVFVAGTQAATLTLPVSSTGEGGLLDVAFAPDYSTSGRAFVYYVASSDGHAAVDDVYRTPSGLQVGTRILDLGAVPGGVNPGGGLELGPDGKLYVGVGDLGNPSAAQNDAALAGKTLRANLDGSVPADNASGTLVWAKGFRNAKDLALNPATARTNGTLYASDLGTGSTVYDEVNAVRAGGNYGWSNGSGSGYGDPPLYWDYQVTPEALEVLRGPSLGASADGSLVYACVQVDHIHQSFLSGPEMDVVGSERRLYDPVADRDGTPDAGCPKQFSALTVASDGWLYGSNHGTNPGIWRIWKDEAGPREVSSPGSPFPLTVAKDGGNLRIGWENLGTLDTGRPARHSNQHAARYQVWEGTLPIAGYDHLAVLDTDGLAEGPARLTATIAPGAGSQYYLVTAQGDNKEGSFGAGRPLPADYCDDRGWGRTVNSCAQIWRNPLTNEEHRLKDYNPNSPTYGQWVTLSDFRGRVIRMDISANDCFWCDVQSTLFPALDRKYRDRDMVFITLFMRSYADWSAFATEAECATYIAAWAADHGETSAIVCDTDLNGDGRADAAWQWRDTACGTPQNYYIDQGNVVYKYVCGAELSSSTIEGAISSEVNPESCE